MRADQARRPLRQPLRQANGHQRMTALADRFPALGRHWSVLREAWRMQNEADRNPSAIAEHEFLPAALEIMEKPPSPGLRILILLLCALFAIALLWSVLGRVDVVAVASGKTMPAANVKLIQSAEIAVGARHPCPQRPACAKRPAPDRARPDDADGRRGAGVAEAARRPHRRGAQSGAARPSRTGAPRSSVARRARRPRSSRRRTSSFAARSPNMRRNAPACSKAARSGRPSYPHRRRDRQASPNSAADRPAARRAPRPRLAGPFLAAAIARI